MTEPQEYDLQVLMASGPENLARAVLGFAFAVSAAVSGARVLVVLTLDAGKWLTEDEPLARQKVNGFDSVESYLSVLKEMSAVVRVCSACVVGECSVSTAENEPGGRALYIGLTEAAIRTSRGSVQTVVF